MLDALKQRLLPEWNKSALRSSQGAGLALAVQRPGSRREDAGLRAAHDRELARLECGQTVRAVSRQGRNAMGPDGSSAVFWRDGSCAGALRAAGAGNF